MPVLLTRPHDRAPDLDREPTLKRVLIAPDGLPLAEQIVEPAVEVGALLGTHFTLVRAVRPVVLPEYALEGSGVVAMVKGLETLDVREKALCDEAEKYLEATAVRRRKHCLNVRTRVAVEDRPALAILREARRADADLVALATHGRRGLSRLFLGSVTDKVLRGGRPAVLLRRPLPT